MTPYDQQMYGAGVAGDCLVTCVEAILEIPQGYLPKPALRDLRGTDEFSAYVDRIAEALWPLNLTLLTLRFDKDAMPLGYSVCTKRRPHSRVGHCLVALDGEPVHDPCPLFRDEPLGAVVDWIILLPLDPARPSGRLALEVRP